MTYDLIIAGGGCSGLSLALQLIESGQFLQKKILIVDREMKEVNDRTWCFWETEPGPFEALVYKSWDRLQFHGSNFSRQLQLHPYKYKLIRGIDFYRHAYQIIRSQSNVQLMIGKIQSITNEPGRAAVLVNGETFTAPYVFNSLILKTPDLSKHYSLQQHFKGWFLKTAKPVFNSELATLMDFRVSQKHGTTFVYVLPFDEHHALVEYTLFTRDLLPANEYDAALDDYVKHQLGIPEFSIDESEFGVIPMTTFPFPERVGRIINIGTAGGQTKASSGYTFQFIQKQTKLIVDALVKTGHPPAPGRSQAKRFSFYDSILLRILDKRQLEGKDVFTGLFQNGDTPTVLKFLDNETSFTEELNIMNRLPKGVFASAALKELFK